MLNLWFVHSAEVSLPDQIVAQVRMAVLAGDIAPGERLPSVRALARRFSLHHNTVSTAYRRLEQEGVVTMRRGSGVYVREGAPPASVADTRQWGQPSLDRMLAGVVEIARGMGLTPDELQHRLTAALQQRNIQRILLIEPEIELRQILLTELRAALTLSAQAQDFPPNGEQLNVAPGTLIVAAPSKAEAVRATLPQQAAFLTLRISSAAGSLSLHLPASKAGLVGLASHWPRFLDIGRTMLLAAGIEPDALLVRDAREPGWQAGLEQTAAVVCDSFTVTCLATGIRALPFALIAEESFAEIREHASTK